ncbi:hypothetical protein [Flindersiella endophytica]
MYPENGNEQRFEDANAELAPVFERAAEFARTVNSGTPIDGIPPLDIASPIRVAQQARNAAEDLLADDRLYPEGRKRLAEEAVAKGAETVESLLAQTEAQLQVRDAALYARALPQLDPAQEASARDDLRLALELAGDDKQSVLRGLARRDDALGALVVGRTGELVSKSLSLEADFHASLRSEAINAGLDSPTRREAVQRYKASKQAGEQALITARFLVGRMLDRESLING